MSIEIKTSDDALTLIRKGFILFEPQFPGKDPEFVDPLKPTVLAGILCDPRPNMQRKTRKFFNSVVKQSGLTLKSIELPGCVPGRGISLK
jgi:uncharacterized protein (DUF2267 family)